jgi:hypothetical protein
MKNYYVCSKENYLCARQFMSTAHFVDLEDGQILLAAEFSNGHLEDVFLNQPGVSMLPHPLSGETMADYLHKDALKKLLPNIQDGHTSYQVGQLAKKVHPLMGPRF